MSDVDRAPILPTFSLSGSLHGEIGGDTDGTSEVVWNYFFRRYVTSAFSCVELKLISDDIAFWRGEDLGIQNTSGSGRWGPLRWNFMTPSGLKVFDVIGRRTSILSLRRVVAVNRYYIVVTSITSSIELRATKVSSIISKLYRKSDSFHVAEHVVKCLFVLRRNSIPDFSTFTRRALI